MILAAPIPEALREILSGAELNESFVNFPLEENLRHGSLSVYKSSLEIEGGRRHSCVPFHIY